MLFVFAWGNTSSKLVDIRWIKGDLNSGQALYEKWNALSRIAVGQHSSEPFGWGMSPAYRPTKGLQQLLLNIDSGAATVITKFDGDLAAVEHLKYDVTALARYLRSNASVFIVSVADGRPDFHGLWATSRCRCGNQSRHHQCAHEAVR
jgi:hypothetical protein